MGLAVSEDISTGSGRNLLIPDEVVPGSDGFFPASEESIVVPEDFRSTSEDFFPVPDDFVPASGSGWWGIFLG